MGYVYLLHFDKPLKHAKHYIGYAENDVEQRLEKHKSGQGARLLQVITEKGIGFKLAKTWNNASRSFERALKNKKNAPRFCPICKSIKAGRVPIIVKGKLIATIDVSAISR